MPAQLTGFIDINLSLTAGMAPHGAGITVAAQAYRCYVLNTVNQALTQFTGYGFNGFADAGGGTYLASSPDGIYEIDTGDTDDGAYINAEIQTGYADYHAGHVNYPRQAWITMRAAKDMQVELLEDENIGYPVPVTDFLSGQLQQSRVKFPMGIRGRHYALSIKNLDGGDFDLNDIRVLVKPVPYRVR